ncbi:hypothetical protein Syun_000106 [Stephania yunnanensis]|uniref:ADP,ATP carrier protein n=1 Tax=Stephania yunnanensis TaxID=152371 RepID=A0AAP0Q9I5_9MAGN
MVGLPFDCLSNPLGAVRVTFERAIASGSDPASFDGKDWGVIDVVRECLFDQGALTQPNSLVRFRGMVQDMLGNEFYVGAFKDDSMWRTNKFADVASFPMGSSSENRIWERRLLHCVPVPGQSSWSMQSSSESVISRSKKWMSQHGEKRLREDDAESYSMAPGDEMQESPTGCKKMREGDCHSPLLHEAVAEASSSKSSIEFNTDSNCFSCLVKVYDTMESDVKLNDVFEFIGVFTYNPELMIQMDESDEVPHDLYEESLVHLPPNKVPRLHCFIQRKLAVHDFIHNSPVTEGAREGLLDHLRSVLGNDCVAAQCVLLHLLSRDCFTCILAIVSYNNVIASVPKLVGVHSRVESAALGKLSLNLTGFSRESISVFGNQLRNAIQSLLPFTQSFPLTVEYLNSVSLAPRKDYKTNRLVTGVLQMAEGTHLTIDETHLDSGILNSTGVSNTRLLKNLLECQKVEYDFEYYKMEMPADVQLLILSDGKSNILPADLVLPFQPSAVSPLMNIAPEALQTWRWYLSSVRSLSHDIDPEMQKVLEDDLVAARQEDRSLGSQDLSRLLTMARLISVSFGETRLSFDHWQMAKELELDRILVSIERAILLSFARMINKWCRVEAIVSSIVSVRPHEISALIYSSSCFFFILSAYFVVLPLRDEGAISLGLTNLPELFLGSLVLTLIAAPVSTLIFSLPHLSKDKALALIHRFFSVSLVVFFILWHFSSVGNWSPSNYKVLASHLLKSKEDQKSVINQGSSASSATWGDHGLFYVSVRIGLFLWVALLNLITISSTWARVIDVMDNESGSRLFGFIGAGATLGQLFGSLFAAGMAWMGPFLLLFAALLMELAAQSSKGICHDPAHLPVEMSPIIEANPVQKCEAAHPCSSSKSYTSLFKPRIWVMFEGLQLIVRSRYLLYVSLFLWLSAVVSSFFYFQKVNVIAMTISSSLERRRLFAEINSFIAVFILAGQLTITGRILTLAGVTTAICLAPCVAFSNMIVIAVWPTWIVVAITEILRKMVTYVLTRPARELLFTVVSVDEKYKAKVCIDVIIQRLGDAAAAGIYKLLGNTLNGKMSTVPLYALPCVLWCRYVSFGSLQHLIWGAVMHTLPNCRIQAIIWDSKGVYVQYCPGRD